MSQDKMRILLVEDSAIAARLISLLIKEGMPDENYDLHSATNLTDAIRITKSENIQIVLLGSWVARKSGTANIQDFFCHLPLHSCYCTYLAMKISHLALKAV